MSKSTDNVALVCARKYVHVNSMVSNVHKKLKLMRQVSLQFLCEHVRLKGLSLKCEAILSLLSLKVV